MRDMLCPSCGVRIGDDRLICPACGKQTRQIEAAQTVPPELAQPPREQEQPQLESGPYPAYVPPGAGVTPSPVRETSSGFTSAGLKLGTALIIGTIYGVARSIDLVVRLHLIDQIRSGGLTLDLQAKAAASDSRNNFFVIASWVLAILLILSYQSWRREPPGTNSLARSGDWRSPVIRVLWVLALFGQLTRVFSPSHNLAALHTSTVVNLISRLCIIPASLISLDIVRRPRNERTQA